MSIHCNVLIIYKRKIGEKYAKKNLHKHLSSWHNKQKYENEKNKKAGANKMDLENTK